LGGGRRVLHAELVLLDQHLRRYFWSDHGYPRADVGLVEPGTRFDHLGAARWFGDWSRIQLEAAAGHLRAAHDRSGRLAAKKILGPIFGDRRRPRDRRDRLPTLRLAPIPAGIRTAGDQVQPAGVEPEPVGRGPGPARQPGVWGHLVLPAGDSRIRRLVA